MIARRRRPPSPNDRRGPLVAWLRAHGRRVIAVCRRVIAVCRQRSNRPARRRAVRGRGRVDHAPPIKEPPIAARDLADASVLVVGATGGLGSRISQQLAKRGAALTLVGSTAEHVEAVDVDGEMLVHDMRLPSNVDAAVDAAVEAHGRLDVVINAAGVVAFGAAAELSSDTVEDLFLLNTFMPIMLAQSALRHLGDGGVIVNISAVVAERPMPGMAAYSASKAALTAFDQALAREVRRDGIRVLDVRPPHTETDLADHAIAGTPPGPPGGLDPDDVAARIVQAIAEDEADLPSDAF